MKTQDFEPHYENVGKERDISLFVEIFAELLREEEVE